MLKLVKAALEAAGYGSDDITAAEFVKLNEIGHVVVKVTYIDPDAEFAEHPVDDNHSWSYVYVSFDDEKKQWLADF